MLDKQTHQSKVMINVLITGATGNVGSQVVKYLNSESGIEIIAGLRDIEKDKIYLESYPDIQYRKFDFKDLSVAEKAFSNIDILFLLRPPQISDVDGVFKPLLELAKSSGINKIVFLSVQGAEKSTVIPHNKIETLIKKIGFEYIFVRPAYFMQNLTTQLLPEIKNNRSITLPSGDAAFNWVDVHNIGEATAKLIAGFDNYKNSSYEITGDQNLSFNQVSSIMSDILGVKITYNQINPVSFWLRKRKELGNSSFATVMTVLHFLPRLQEPPKISGNYKKLTSKSATSIIEFIKREKGFILA
jgi:uncharacterized protein YbjT (DUF2867 family)